LISNDLEGLCKIQTLSTAIGSSTGNINRISSNLKQQFDKCCNAKFKLLNTF
jgi:hypothetical protein